jgi:hypothetical protein
LKDEVDYHPIYQRDIRWSQEAMCDLISTIMLSGLIPGIILYKLQPTDEKKVSSHEWECIDGQHRFFTISHFWNGTYVNLPGKKPFLISWKYEGISVFYKETDDIKAWIAENPRTKVAFMTDEEKSYFNNFKLDIRSITSPLALQQRREIFTSLQKGVPVRGSDLYKNYTEITLVKFISEEKRWEEELKQKLLTRLTMQPKLYWLHWIIRLFLMSITEDVCDMFVITDSEITKYMKANSPKLACTPEELENFELYIIRFFNFLDSLPSGVTLSPTHFYSLFAHFTNAEEDREDILRDHIRTWSKEGLGKKYRKMWENRGDITAAERQDYFLRCLDQLERFTTPAEKIPARKNIPIAIREAIWDKAKKEDGSVSCYCCTKELSQKNWHAGHIVAHACGGLDNEENLRPVCMRCNDSMGTENMDQFKKRCYPKTL